MNLCPAKQEVPLAVQLANKTKERGIVMGRIQHYRNVCRDLETRLMKESAKFEAVARKSALQDEIKEIEVRITEEESTVPPGAPSGPPPGCADGK